MVNLDFLKSAGEMFGSYFLGPAIFAALGYIIAKLKAKWKDKRPVNIKMSAEKNDKIHEILTEMRVRFNADRAYLTMFHNGDKYIDGSEILKKTRTNESVGFGVNMDVEQFQSLNCSLMPDEMKISTQNVPTFIKTIDILDSKFKRTLEMSGVKAVARYPVKKVNDIIGFIGLDFINQDGKPQDIDNLIKYAGIIEQVLTTYR